MEIWTEISFPSKLSMDSTNQLVVAGLSAVALFLLIKSSNKQPGNPKDPGKNPPPPPPPPPPPNTNKCSTYRFYALFQPPPWGWQYMKYEVADPGQSFPTVWTAHQFAQESGHPARVYSYNGMIGHMVQDSCDNGKDVGWAGPFPDCAASAIEVQNLPGGDDCGPGSNTSEVLPNRHGLK